MPERRPKGRIELPGLSDCVPHGLGLKNFRLQTSLAACPNPFESFSQRREKENRAPP